MLLEREMNRLSNDTIISANTEVASDIYIWLCVSFLDSIIITFFLKIPIISDFIAKNKSCKEGYKTFFWTNCKYTVSFLCLLLSQTVSIDGSISID